jgi:hypothetical protein
MNKGKEASLTILVHKCYCLYKVVDKAICDSRVPRSRPPMCASGTRDLLGSTPSPNCPALAPRIGEGT